MTDLEDITARCSGGKAPRCSVVMPVYNTEEAYLRQAIESILGQTYRDFELLVVDDHSAPYVREVIASYADERIRYFRMETQSGAAAARNRALEEARGEFIAFMDSDDISLPERFAKQVAYLEAHPEIGCLGATFRQLKVDKLSHCPANPTEHAAIESYLLFCGCAFCQSSVMVRRALLEAHEIRYRTEYVPAEDYALWLEFIGKTRFATLKDELVYYRIHPHSISCQAYDVQMERLAAAQSAAVERCGGFTFATPGIWHRFKQGGRLAAQEYKDVNDRLEQVVSALCASGVHTEQDVMPAVRAFVRKAFYHTRSLKGQLRLFRLPIGRQLKLPLWWRLFCFISRGIL